MLQSVKPIPIVILTKDEPDFLKSTVQSIISRTDYPFVLYIVDNASSSDDQKTMLLKIESSYDVKIIHNVKNEWLLGFNAAIAASDKESSLDDEFIVLSDGDILVPLRKDGMCWLSFLMLKMRDNAVIGKIGLALDRTLIRSRKAFSKTYAREEKYMAGPKIGDMIVAPVDTTLALYRKDLFVMDRFKMLPGHASLVRPYYYTVRAPDDLRCKHLGWRSYHSATASQIDDKVYCFSKYAGYIDPIVLKTASKKAFFHYIFLGKLYKIYWGANVVYKVAIYLLKNFPRKINKITDSLR